MVGAALCLLCTLIIDDDRLAQVSRELFQQEDHFPSMRLLVLVVDGTA